MTVACTRQVTLTLSLTFRCSLKCAWDERIHSITRQMKANKSAHEGKEESPLRWPKVDVAQRETSSKSLEKPNRQMETKRCRAKRSNLFGKTSSRVQSSATLLCSKGCLRHVHRFVSLFGLVRLGMRGRDHRYERERS